MSKKIFLIAVLVISLVLIGLMMLVADVRMNSILDDFSTEEKKLEDIIDESSNEKINRKQLEATKKKYPVVIQQFQTVSEELLQYTQSLKEDFKVGDSFEEMEAKKNEIFFIKNTDEYSEKGTEFIAKIEAYEAILATVYLEFPKTKTETTLRTKNRGEDWLIYNFKDFPTIAVYAKLVNIEEVIKRKQKEIVEYMLSK